MRKRLNYYSLFQRIASLVLAVLLIPIPSFAQSSSETSSSVDQSTPGALAAGTHPLGSYGGSSFDSVNLFSGNLSLSFPIAALSGRGGVGGGVSLSYNSKFWRTENKSNSNRDGSNSYAIPTYDVYDNEKPILAPGWNLHLGRMVGRQSSWSDLVNGTTNGYTLTTFTFSAPDGTEYNFRDDLTDGQPLIAGNKDTPNQSRGKKFHSTDGTAATFVSNDDVVDIPAALHQHKLYPDGIVILRDGTRFILARGKVKEQHDRNGNIARYEYQGARLTKITDSIGRTINLDYTEAATQPDPTVLEIKVTIKGFGGADRVTSIKFGRLQDSLLGTLTNKTYPQLFPLLDVPAGKETEPFNPIIIKQIDLPSTHQWKFLYNEYAEVARVETPTRGAVEYDMSMSAGAPVFQNQNKEEIFRRIAERRIYPNASSTTFEGRTVYGDPSTDAAVQGVVEKVFSGDGKLIARTRHKFAYSPLANYGDTGVPPKTGYQRWMQGKEIETVELSLAGNDATATVKRLTQNTWEQRAPISWITGSTTTFTEQPDNDPRVKTKTVTYPDSGQVFRTEYLYDDNNGFGGFNNLTTESIFDNDVLLRKTVRTYETDINYVQYQDSSTDQNLVIRPHLRSLIKSEEVFHLDSNNTDIKESRIEYEYDNYTTNSLQSLTFAANDTSHNTNYGTSFTRRGNLTRTTSGIPGQVNGFSEQSTITTQYDIAGNVIKTVGPLPTQIATLEYDTNNFYFPLASHQVVPGVPQEFVTRKTFDFSTGLTTSTTGINGEMTSYFYNDPEFLDRITEIRRPFPFLGKTTYTYSPVGAYPFWIKTQTQQDNNAGNDLITIGYFDGWLKPIKSEKFDPDGNITNETSYDGLGRAFKVTNPHRAAPADTDGYTITEYEDLGRTSKLTTFDKNGSSTGSIISAYLGTTTTVTDQALKQRKSKSDALGRLTSIFEPDTNNQLTLETQYKYNARSKLIEVDQEQQVRAFAYDSQSRLRRATTPEAGITNYVYDEASNLRIKTDARGTTTTYTYDALNRIKTRTYSDNTPPASYFYDGILSGLPAGINPPQGYQPGTALGRLVAVATPNMAANNVVPSLNATATFYSYDLVGRITNGYQLIDGQYFHTNTNYNLASEPTHFQYPSANVLDYTYNSAGQLDSENYNNNPIASQIKYSANGAITQQQLGNGLYHNITYNSRFQPTTISLGSTANGENSYDKIRLDYDYGLYPIDTLSSATSPLPDNVQLDQTKNNGNIGRTKVTHGIFTGGGGGGSTIANSGAKGATIIKGGKPLYNLTFNATMEQGFAYDELNRLVLAKEFTAPTPTGPACPQITSGGAQVEPGTTTTVLLTGSDLNTIQQVNVSPSTGISVSLLGVTSDQVYLSVITSASSLAGNYTLTATGSCGEISAGSINVSCLYTTTLALNPTVEGADAVGGFSFDLTNFSKDGVSTLNTPTAMGSGSIDIDLTSAHFDATIVPQPILRLEYSSRTDLVPSSSVTATFQGFINGQEITIGRVGGTGTPTPVSDTLTVNVDSAGNVSGNGDGANRDGRDKEIDIPLTGYIGQRITFTYQSNITVTGGATVAGVSTRILGFGACTVVPSAQPLVNVIEPSPLVAGVSWSQQYTYDRYGNRTKVVGDNAQTLHIAPTNNQITSVENNANPYTYDSVGNVKTDQQGNTYFYDAENHLIKAQFGTNFFIFQYDGDGHRVKKGPLGGGGKLYVHAGTGQLIAEYQQLIIPGIPTSGIIDKEYIYGASGLVATNISGSSLEFITTDHLGSPRVFTDAGGNIISRHDYFPFGEEITASFNGRSAMGGFGGSDNLAHKFTGYERDDETGLDFAQARYFQKGLSRFMSADPIFGSVLNPQTWNRYAYVVNNPLKFADPTGLFLQGPQQPKDDGLDGEFTVHVYITNLDEIDIIGLETLLLVSLPFDLSTKLLTGSYSNNRIVIEKKIAAYKAQERANLTPIQRAISDYAEKASEGFNMAAGGGLEYEGAEILSGVIKETTVSAESLNVVGSTQPELFEGTIEGIVNKLKTNPEEFWQKSVKTDGPIEIWEINGQRFLYNGNHRYQAAVEAGVNIPAYAVKIVQKSESQIPTFLLKNMERIPGEK